MIVKVQNNKNVSELTNEFEALLGEKSLKQVNGKSFSGIEEINYILSIGGGVIITQLANILVNWMKRNQAKSVKVGNVEITGYTIDEVERLLEKISCEEKTDE